MMSQTGPAETAVLMRTCSTLFRIGVKSLYRSDVTHSLTSRQIWKRMKTLTSDSHNAVLYATNVRQLTIYIPAGESRDIPAILLTLFARLTEVIELEIRCDNNVCDATILERLLKQDVHSYAFYSQNLDKTPSNMMRLRRLKLHCDWRWLRLGSGRPIEKVDFMRSLTQHQLDSVARYLESNATAISTGRKHDWAGVTDITISLTCLVRGAYRFFPCLTRNLLNITHFTIVQMWPSIMVGLYLRRK
jgi:hypothetical protein